jgi:hypothetical protein
MLIVLQRNALPTELREDGELPRGFEPRAVDSKSTVLTNYTIGATLSIFGIFSLSSFTYFILMSETENKLAEVLATIIGTTVKYTEYTRPRELANMLRFKKE